MSIIKTIKVTLKNGESCILQPWMGLHDLNGNSYVSHKIPLGILVKFGNQLEGNPSFVEKIEVTEYYE